MFFHCAGYWCFWRQIRWGIGCLVFRKFVECCMGFGEGNLASKDQPYVKSTNTSTWYVDLYIYRIYLEPVCPLFWGLNPPKEGLFQSKQGFIWVPGMYYVAPPDFEGTFGMTLELVISGNGWTLRCANNGWMDCLRLEAVHTSRNWMSRTTNDLEPFCNF